MLRDVHVHALVKTHMWQAVIIPKTDMSRHGKARLVAKVCGAANRNGTLCAKFMLHDVTSCEWHVRKSNLDFRVLITAMEALYSSSRKKRCAHFIEHLGRQCRRWAGVNKSFCASHSNVQEEITEKKEFATMIVYKSNRCDSCGRKGDVVKSECDGVDCFITHQCTVCSLLAKTCDKCATTYCAECVEVHGVMCCPQ
jgi:hypothetical protein